MEPSAHPNGLPLKVGDLRKAVELYLSVAYPAGDFPSAVKRRLDWPVGVDAETLLNAPPFERAGRSRDGGSAIYALRLGNARYPHMKLQIQPWPCPAGFLLSVNTHDQVLAIDPTSIDAESFRALQAENARVKESIETCWDQAGLPTFLRYLRDFIDGQSSCVANPGD